MTADKDEGSRSMSGTKYFMDVKYHLVDCHKNTGAIPLWKSCSPSTWFAFINKKGTEVPISDLSLLSSWEYVFKQGGCCTHETDMDILSRFRGGIYVLEIY